MSVPFYEERQTNPPWIGWLVVFSGVAILGILLVVFINKYEESAGLWTDDLSGLAGAAAGSSVAIAVAAWLVFTTHLSVSISSEGITYTYVPSFWKPKHVPPESIEAFEVREMGWPEYVASGGRKRRIASTRGNKEVCIIHSLTVADLTLPGGRRLLLGTRNPDGLLWALKKLKGMQ